MRPIPKFALIEQTIANKNPLLNKYPESHQNPRRSYGHGNVAFRLNDVRHDTILPFANTCSIEYGIGDNFNHQFKLAKQELRGGTSGGIRRTSP